MSVIGEHAIIFQWPITLVSNSKTVLLR